MPQSDYDQLCIAYYSRQSGDTAQAIVERYAKHAPAAGQRGLFGESEEHEAPKNAEFEQKHPRDHGKFAEKKGDENEKKADTEEKKIPTTSESPIDKTFQQVRIEGEGQEPTTPATKGGDE